MRVSILSLFLSLILISFGTTLTFLYYKNYESLSNLSDEIIDLSSDTLTEKVSALFEETKEVVLSSSSLIHKSSDVNPDNQNLLSYMFAIIRNHPDMPYLFVGTKEGNYLEVGNLEISVQTHFLTDTSKPLPPDVVYEWQYFIPKDGQIQGKSFYLNKDMQIIAQEDVSHSGYNPRERPWYKQGLKEQKFSWTDVYLFFDTGNPGITAVQPVYTPQGEFIGVFGADLSFHFLSMFFSTQTIGKRGKAFIIDKTSGKQILPSLSETTEKLISQDIVSQAYQLFQVDGNENFHFHQDGVRYLAHFQPFQTETEADWLIAVIVPSDDFFSTFERIQMHVFAMILSICLFSSVAIAYFAQRLSRPIVQLTQEIDQIKHLNLDTDNRVSSHIKEIDQMDSSISSMKLAFRSFIHYVPKEIVRQLLSQNKEIALGGEKKEITVFFSDIADFTSMVETLPNEVFMPLLAEYFDKLSRIILEKGGTIDKYIGDSIMAFWGAPTEREDHTTACAEAALLCNACVKELNEEREKEGKPLFFTRFGINTGAAIVGNIGTTERMNYTLIGDVVNSASRLQGVNKIYKTRITISEDVRKKLDDSFLIRPLDIIEVKGKKTKIQIFELLGKERSAPSIAPTNEDRLLSQRFSQAFQAFQSNDLSLARQLFKELHRNFPNDAPTQLYLERLTKS